MIEWEETNSGVRAYNSAKNEITVSAPDWERAQSNDDIPYSVDATVSGFASELQFPPVFAYIKNTTTGESHQLGSNIGPISLPEGEYLVHINQDIKTYVQFEGAAEIRKTEEYDALILSFPNRRSVTLGFRSRLERPEHTITVPPTPDGLATALSHLSASHETKSPDRSYHVLRHHPALLETGSSYDIPDAVVDATPDTDIELAVPESFDSLFVVAPLAYYLQASVRTADRDTVALTAPSVDVFLDLGSLPDLQHEVADLLYRVFSLDCLVRNGGPLATNLGEAPLLDDVNIDAEKAYNADPSERLATYLNAPFENIVDDLPNWHLSMYVDPDPEYMSCLPFLLDSLAMLYLPETSQLEGRELMRRSLDDFYRSNPSEMASGQFDRMSGSGPVASIDTVKPQLQRGRVHGWLADGIPIDVFKTVPDAYENRLDYFERDHQMTTVTVVLNDREMDGEHAAVAEIYEERSEDLPIDVTVLRNVSRAELADVFEQRTDFVHYIGHCEEDGLRCRDGNLAIADIDESNVQTFFLNACGSYYEGIELVHKGSVAGAVTFKPVLNEQAAKVGTAFARLLINGFSIERALRLSRRRIMMGKDYAVVGDGTHVLTQCDNYIPTTASLEEGDSEYNLTIEAFSPRIMSGFYQPYIPGNDQSYLCGNEAEFALEEDALCSYLSRAKMPVVYDGSFYWSEELAEKLRG